MFNRRFRGEIGIMRRAKRRVVGSNAAGFRFAATYVRMRPFRPRKWDVDECVATTKLSLFMRLTRLLSRPIRNDPVQLTSNLPKEPCTVEFDLNDGLYMQVMAIQAPTTFTLPDGRKGSGLMTYPDCLSHPKTDRSVWTVDQVVSAMECEV